MPERQKTEHIRAPWRKKDVTWIWFQNWFHQYHFEFWVQPSMCEDSIDSTFICLLVISPGGACTWTLTSLDLGLWDAFEILGCIGPNWISAHCSQLYKWLCKACWGPAQLEHRSYPCSVGSSASGECTSVRYVFIRFLFIWRDSCVYVHVCVCLRKGLKRIQGKKQTYTHTHI